MSTLEHTARGDAAPPSPARRDGLLLSGATGLLGTELLARYLQETERQIFAIVRADDDAHAQRRMDETLEGAFGRAGCTRAGCAPWPAT